MKKIVIQPFGEFTPSKHRNSKRNLTFVDSSGKKIKGDPKKHFQTVFIKQEERFNTKLEAFNLLTSEELKSLYLQVDKLKVKSSTDKAALIQAYYNNCYKKFSDQSKEDLESIKSNTLNNLNDIEIKALNNAIKEK